MSTTKKRRGRPRLNFPASAEPAAEVLSRYTSEHGKADARYRQLAIDALSTVRHQTAWIYDEAGITAKRPKAQRPTVLTELGRLIDPDLIRHAAVSLTKDVEGGVVTTSREAVKSVRFIRSIYYVAPGLRRTKQESAAITAKALLEAVRRYSANVRRMEEKRFDVDPDFFAATLKAAEQAALEHRRLVDDARRNTGAHP